MRRKIRLSFLFTGFILAAATSFAQPDSVTWIASEKYAYPSLVTRLLLGSNYRHEWETPVKLPVFHMKALGLTIKELGGGQQTTSLQLKDEKGREWSLRSVDKDVKKALPENLRKGFILNLTQQIISAAHPYVPVTVPPLADKMKVIVARPVIYFVPDDPAFGEFRSLFANTVCLLEEREPTPDNSDTKGTDKLLEKMFESNDKQIDQKAVLRARLLDMMIGDWDRHSEQWRWAERKDQGQTYIYPIPRDRDQAYFYSDGMFVRLMQVLVLKHLVSYNNDLEKVKSFNYKSWPFDRLFMNSLDKQDWTDAIKEVQAVLTDDVIHEAFKKLPPEIFAIRGETLDRKFTGRRDKLLEKGMRYYRFMASDVKVYGSNETEYFHVTGDDHTIVVTVFEYREGRPAKELYKRSFIKGETHFITLRGLKGDDHFFVDEKATAGIRMTIEGEEGNDSYEINSGKKIRIKDSAEDIGKIKANSRVKTMVN
jgi:hypothetical protein